MPKTDNLGDAVGMPKTITIKGKEYTFSPLTVNDYAELEEFIKSHRQEQIRKLKLPAEKEAEALLATLDADIDEIGDKLQVARYTWWLALRRNHKNLKLKDMGDLIDESVIEQINEVTGVAEAGPPDAEGVASAK